MSSFKRLINWYFSKDKLPYWCILILDCLIIFFTSIIVYWFFFNLTHLRNNFFQLTGTIGLYMVCFAASFRLFHTYSGIVRYSSFVDLQKIGLAMSTSGLLVIFLNYLVRLLPPSIFVHILTRHLVAIIVISTFLMWGLRLFVKMLYDSFFRTEGAVNAFIYGAKDGAVGLAKQIRNEKPARFNLRGFISHDSQLKHTRLLGQKVYEVDQELPSIMKKEGISALLVSPQCNDLFREEQELQKNIINAGFQIYMMKDVEAWSKDSVSKPALKEVSIADLLPRDQISVDMGSVAKLINGKTVLITGSAGSIGSEICRQICSYSPSEMILIDQAETPQHQLRLELGKKYPEIKIQTLVASITNEGRMENIFSQAKPDYVFHAAAYKHVPMMEDNPSESVHNNIYGTKLIADLSVKFGVKKFVMISTDKAVNPTNVMGCSKRICEIYVQSLNRAQERGVVKGETQFVTTRFGNVLGSNGSVIPIFEEQIRQGGPVTVTDPDIIRYFMLISEACKLVLEAGTKGRGGEIFVFDMGRPVKIADLAMKMIKLSGAHGVEIKYTGLRNGEKLYEEVLNEEETTKPSFHDKIRIASVRECDYEKAENSISKLIELAKSHDSMQIVAAMKRIVPEYKSNNSVFSVLD